METNVLLDDRFDELYTRHIDRLTRIVLRRLWRGQSGADSVIQGILLSYVGHLRNDPAVTRDDELWRLLFCIALRHLDNANHRTARWRKAAGARAMFRDSGSAGTPDGGFEAADPGPNFLTEADGADWVANFFDTLTPFEREVAKSRLAGHTIPEIAKLTGATEVRVRRTLDFIRKLLRELLEREDGNGTESA